MSHPDKSKTARIEKRPARLLDPVLLPFLRVSGEAETKRHLERLLKGADPVIQGIIRIKWRSSPPSATGSRPGRDGSVAEDLRGEVVLSLLKRLNDLKANPDQEPIGNFRAFVAVTTYRACDHHLRQKYPQRASLHNRLYYLLTKQSSQQGFALWQGRDGKRLCGFAPWRAEGRTPARTGRYQQLLDHPRAVMAEELPGEDILHLNPGDLLAAIFNRVDCPLELDDLVSIMADLWGIGDEPEQADRTNDDPDADPYERVADPRADVATQIDQRAYLQQLWSEIRQLPPRQCAALLLNLRDPQGRGIIALLPLRGIATLRQIADALGMTAEQFATLWNDLPIDDVTIAAHLSVTRQQVINLRKVARERLARRMRLFDVST